MHIRWQLECLIIPFQRKCRVFTYFGWDGWLCFPGCVAITVSFYIVLGSSFFDSFTKRVDFFFEEVCISCSYGCLHCLNTYLSYRTAEVKPEKGPLSLTSSLSLWMSSVYFISSFQGFWWHVWFYKNENHKPFFFLIEFFHEVQMLPCLIAACE